MNIQGYVKEKAVGKTTSWKILSWKVRNEIGKNDAAKFGPKLESSG